MGFSRLTQQLGRNFAGWGLDDWIILGIVTTAWIVSTVFLFAHPTEANFATWAGFGATEVGAYHWLSIIDDTHPDASHKPEGQ